MIFWHILAAALGILLVGYAFSSVARELMLRMTSWLALGLGNVLDKSAVVWIPIVLACGFFFCLAHGRNARVTETAPRQPSPKVVEQEQPVAERQREVKPRPKIQELETRMDQSGTLPSAQVVLRLPGKLVAKEEEEKTVPVTNAVVRMGQDQTNSGADGSFVLSCTQPPGKDAFLSVSHGSYVTLFRRVDALWIHGAEKPELELHRKMRIIVKDFEFEGMDSQVSETYRKLIRSNTESCWTSCGQVELLAQKERDALLKEISNQQAQKGIYDAKTLARAKLFGATHGVFGFVRKKDAKLKIESNLINFTTGQIEQTAATEVATERELDADSVKIADRMLAHFTEMGILSKPESQTGPSLALEGYITFRPKDWRMFISVLPAGNSSHYPQARVTPQTDGNWVASALHLGEGGATRKQKFEIYTFIADREATTKLEAYISNKSNTGLDLVSWGEDHCRILDRITVTRLPD
jgi:hypothetical protein